MGWLKAQPWRLSRPVEDANIVILRNLEQTLLNLINAAKMKSSLVNVRPRKNSRYPKHNRGAVS